MNVELFIANESGSKLYNPSVVEGIEWSTERTGSPGKLTFQVIKDDNLELSEGNPVRLTVDGDKIFFGFVFRQQRDREKDIISITAYDQLRYLKNKDSIKYEKMTASQMIKHLADAFGLNTGTLEDTKFVIESMVESGVSLFEIIANAIDATWANTGELFVLYDEFGKLTLKSLDSMMVGDQGTYLLIDEETGENFDYSSSIDDNTFNQVKLVYESEGKGEKDPIVVKDSASIKAWGLLQHYGTIRDEDNGQRIADVSLSMLNKKTRSLKITNAFGDNRVRAGSLVAVNLDLGDTKVQNFMLVERCRHVYNESEHRMDLTLRGGGEFSA